MACAVDVSIENKRPRIHRATVAVDCGLAVNPLTVESQFQAGLAFGLSQLMAKGAITLRDGMVEQRNFDSYVPPYMPDAPVAVDVHIVPSTEAPSGCGEPPVPVISPCGSQRADQADWETLPQPAARRRLGRAAKQEVLYHLMPWEGSNHYSLNRKDENEKDEHETARRDGHIACSARFGVRPCQIRQRATAPPTASGPGSQTVIITRSGSQPSRQGPAENFTGSVRVDPLFQARRSVTHVWRFRHVQSRVPGLHGTRIRLVRS